MIENINNSFSFKNFQVIVVAAGIIFQALIPVEASPQSTEHAVIFFCLKASKLQYQRTLKEEDVVEEEFEKDNVTTKPVAFLPDCESTKNALKKELLISGFDLITILPPPSILQNPDELSAVKGIAESGVSFVIWSDEITLIRIFDAINKQLIKVDFNLIADKPLKAEETAIIVRNIMGTSLLTNMDLLENDDQLIEFSISDEKAAQIANIEKVKRNVEKALPQATLTVEHPPSKPAVEEKKAWFPAFSAGYAMIAYPQASLLFHGANIELKFPLPKNFELSLYGILTAHEATETESAKFINDQYVISLTGSFSFIKKKFVTSWIGLGVSAGISRTKVELVQSEDNLSRVTGNGAIGISSGLRIRIYKPIFFETKIAIDNLFNHERYTYYGSTKFELARIRLLGAISLLITH